MLTRWWFQIFFIFPPYLGKWSKMTNIFQMGWNHQLDNLVCFFMICWFFLFTTSPPPPWKNRIFCYQLLNQPGHTHHILSPPQKMALFETHVWHGSQLQHTLWGTCWKYLCQMPAPKKIPLKTQAFPKWPLFERLPPSLDGYTPQNSSKIFGSSSSCPPRFRQGAVVWCLPWIW